MLLHPTSLIADWITKPRRHVALKWQMITGPQIRAPRMRLIVIIVSILVPHHRLIVFATLGLLPAENYSLRALGMLLRRRNIIFVVLLLVSHNLNGSAAHRHRLHHYILCCAS